MNLICQGRVFHKRMTPQIHQFFYKVFYVRLNMRNVPQSLKLFSMERFNLFSFRAKDYQMVMLQKMEDWLISIFATYGMDMSQKIHEFDIELQTFPRVLFYNFNPVSFWYLKKDGEIIYVIAEVNNTFGASLSYLIHENGKNIIWGKTYQVDKRLHVSPFNKVQGQYQFVFSNFSDKEKVVINYLIDEKLIMTTFIEGKRSPLLDQSLLKNFFTRPFQSLLIIGLIHWQALRLLIKKVPFYGKNPSLTESL